MGVFEFIIVLVIISTFGKVLSQRQPRERLKGMRHNEMPQLPPGEMDRINETIDDLSGRLERLEEERDFYKDLLEAPKRQQGPGATE